MQPAAWAGYGGFGMKCIPVTPYMDPRYRETSHGMYAARGSAVFSILSNAFTVG